MQIKGNVLIVDDDIRLIDIFKTKLFLAGYQCTVTTTGESAYKLIQKNVFHVILIDIVLPDMSGLELTGKIRHIRPEAAVIVMTGFIEEFSYDQAIEMGASDFIKKPFTLNELLMRIEHVKCQKELQTLILRDDLTGLYNRRGFFTIAEQIIKMARRQKNTIYLLYADLDNLKDINDSLGHHYGDTALTDLANILRNNFRESDIIARIGGDEFVVFPMANEGDDTENIIERLYRAIDLYNTQQNRPYTLSISVGTACFNPERPCPADQLLAQADLAMYAQKKQIRTP
jgi:diguanylate cyclase (GGDEF)-like protein